MESSKTIGMSSDLMLEIFSWMPAKAAMKLASVSKTLSSILYEPIFMERQSIRSSQIDGGFFLQPDILWKHPWVELDFHVLPKEPSSAFGVPSDSLSFLEQNGRVLSSSQGLVLFHRIADQANEILIFNPVTWSCVELPVPEQSLVDRGILLECHPRNLKDYTITIPVLVEDKTRPWGRTAYLAVYRNGKWDDEMCDMERDLRCGQLCFDNPVGVFGGHNGGLVVYYLYTSLPNTLRRPVHLESHLVAYDVETKKHCKTTYLPEGAWNESLEIFKWGTGMTSIGLVGTSRRMFSVWVVECLSDSWRKVMSKTISEMGVPEEDGDVVGCCIFNGTSLVFATEIRIYEYDMEAQRLELVAERGYRQYEPMVFTPYTSTLRPLCGEEAQEGNIA